MTQAEKMAKEWLETGFGHLDYGLPPKKAVFNLIHRVAERGIEEALASFNLIAPGKDVPVGMIRDAIRSRRWWEEEIKK